MDDDVGVIDDEIRAENGAEDEAEDGAENGAENGVKDGVKEGASITQTTVSTAKRSKWADDSRAIAKMESIKGTRCPGLKWKGYQIPCEFCFCIYFYISTPDADS